MPNTNAKTGKTVSYRGVGGERRDVVVLGSQKATPTNAQFTATPSGTGGTLATGTYSYKVTVVVEGVETAASTANTAAVTGPTGSVAINAATLLSAYPTATAWKLYGRTGGTELLMTTVNAPTNSFTDTGAITPSGAAPAANGAIRFRDIGAQTVRTQIGKATSLASTNAYFSR